MTLAALALLAAAAAVVLIASPIHRAFYSERAPVLAARAAEQGVLRHIAGSGLPMITGRTTPAAALTVSAESGGRDGVAPNDRLELPLVDPTASRLSVDGVPVGWALKEFTGRAAIGVVSSEMGAMMRLRSDQSSFVIYRDVVVEAERLPWLSWTWKVTRLPAGADVRHAATDDQAAQIYVVFPRWPAPLARSDVIGYVWDTTAPVGTQLTSHKAPNVKIIVVESGAEGIGTWRRQQRNVFEDYQALFGRRPPRLGTVAIMIDSDDTASVAEAWFGALGFSRSPS